MASRADLNNTLEQLLGNTNVYFNPPESIKMRYPAITYTTEVFYFLRANNGIYTKHPGYQLTLIDTDPDSKYVDEILALPYVNFTRYYPASGLHHWVFRLYQE